VAQKHVGQLHFINIPLEKTGDFFNDFASPRVAVLIGKRLEIVEVHLAQRKKLPLCQRLFNPVFNRQISRQPGQRTGVEVERFQHFEPLGHVGKRIGQCSNFIVSSCLDFVIQIPFGNQASGFLQLFQWFGNIARNDQRQRYAQHQAQQTQPQGHLNGRPSLTGDPVHFIIDGLVHVFLNVPELHRHGIDHSPPCCVGNGLRFLQVPVLRQQGFFRKQFFQAAVQHVHFGNRAFRATVKFQTACLVQFFRKFNAALPENLLQFRVSQNQIFLFGAFLSQQNVHELFGIFHQHKVMIRDIVGACAEFLQIEQRKGAGQDGQKRHKQIPQK